MPEIKKSDIEGIVKGIFGGKACVSKLVHSTFFNCVEEYIIEFEIPLRGGPGSNPLDKRTLSGSSWENCFLSYLSATRIEIINCERDLDQLNKLWNKIQGALDHVKDGS